MFKCYTDADIHTVNSAAVPVTEFMKERERQERFFRRLDEKEEEMLIYLEIMRVM